MGGHSRPVWLGMRANIRSQSLRTSAHAQVEVLLVENTMQPDAIRDQYVEQLLAMRTEHAK